MIIQINSETLQDLLTQLIDRINCYECPLYDECQGQDGGSEDCAKSFINAVKIS